MKYYRCLYFFIFALSVKAYAYQPKIEIVEQFDNLRMVAFINKEDADSNPSWIPGSNKLPLTVVEAIRAVNVLSKKLNTIVEIEIRLMPKYKNRWHYLIKTAKTANSAMRFKYNIYFYFIILKLFTNFKNI
jgi:hypothetical protein